MDLDKVIKKDYTNCNRTFDMKFKLMKELDKVIDIKYELGFDGGVLTLKPLTNLVISDYFIKLICKTLNIVFLGCKSDDNHLILFFTIKELKETILDNF